MATGRINDADDTYLNTMFHLFPQAFLQSKRIVRYVGEVRALHYCCTSSNNELLDLADSQLWVHFTYN